MKKKIFLVSTVIMIGVTCMFFYNIKTHAKIVSEIDVCSYGAVGDGITDDTQAIARALKENAGKVIYFPAGIYVIKGKINIYGNTVIKGDGINTKIIAAPGKAAGTELIQIYEEENIQISNICISGNSQVNNGEQYNDQDGIHLLDMWNVSDIEIKECYFIDNVYCAIRIFGGKNITVSDSYILNVDCGVSTLGKYDVDNLTVKNCYFKGHNRSESVSMYGTGAHENIYIYNNVIEDKTDGHGILINDQSVNREVYITNNIIHNCAVAISVFKVTGGEVIDNIVSGTTSGRGMEIYGCNNLLVSNNIISDTNFDSISIKNCSDSKFENNNIMITSNAKNRDMAGIKVLEECNGVTISNNIIKQVSQTLNKFSIYVKGYGDVVIKENSLHGLPVYISENSLGVKLTE